uniref:type I protein arginine methyltransferase n=1 Tax=Spongospora subterranea TaxID=70186 RepID=A0A0H5R8Z1_9EUKA|eukprot:CRZ10590.1 hypothetical protein [Spongospora subterranea]
MLPPCINIQYGVMISKFMIPSSADTLEQLIHREFMLESYVQLGLVIYPEPQNKLEITEGRDPESTTSVANEGVVVPFDIELLKSLADQYTFCLRVYSSASSDSTPMECSVPSSRNAIVTIAQYDFKGKNDSELSFRAGDNILVEYQYSAEWCKGKIVSKTGKVESTSGFFPSNYVSNIPPFVPTASDTTLNCNYQDDEYFEGYSNLSIHLEMLQDTSRTLGYKEAVNIASDFMKDKIVLDIGCGSGVLSLFCANSGAKHVYAIDASSVIEHARVVVNENNLSDKITLIKGKIEEIVLPVEKVDVIISEWMGTLLICESMIASVLSAREKYLAPGGLMMPSLGNIYFAPIDVKEFYDNKIAFWDDVYGLKMSGLKEHAITDFFSKPIFDRIIEESECLASNVLVTSIDMATASVESLESMKGSFHFKIVKSGTMHGFGGWFDCEFRGSPDEGAKTLVLSTSPMHKSTHWRQVTFILTTPVRVEEGDMVNGTMDIRRQSFWRRHFEVELKFSVGDSRESVTQVFPLWR